MDLRNSLSVGLWIAEGLLDKSSLIPGASSSQVGIALFAERKFFVPFAGAWNFNRGKTILPGVSVSCDQVIKLVKGAEDEVDEIKTLSSTSSFSKEITKAAEVSWTLCSLIGEGKEDFKPVGFKHIFPFPF